MRRLFCVAVFAVLATVAPARDARAWGKVGHRAVTLAAEHRLLPGARAKIYDLLDAGETLADASLWADEHRRDVPGSGAWHYVNVPLAEVHYDARFCPPAGCIVSKIRESCATLASNASPRDERQRALRWLVHFVEDLHQPLHVGDLGDRGGNDLQVRFLGRGTNLHRVWDDEIIERHSIDESLWAAELDTLIQRDGARGLSGGTVENWADESLAAARVAYAPPRSPAVLKPGALLGEEYFEATLPLVERRLAQAAVRLSSMLNEIFQTNQTR